MIQDGENGLLVDFFSPKEIAKRVGEALDNPEKMAPLREKARQLIVEKYALKDLLPQHVQIVENVAKGNLPNADGDGFTPQMKAYMQNGNPKSSKGKKKKSKGFALS
jgi:Zn-dependent protease with chaperone function